MPLDRQALTDAIRRQHEREPFSGVIDVPPPHLDPEVTLHHLLSHPGVSFSSTYLLEVGVLCSLLGNAVDGSNAMRRATAPILEAGR